MIRRTIWLGSLAVVAVIIGCARKPSNETAVEAHQPTAEGRKYLLSEEPEGAQDVVAMREQAGHDEEVTVIGRIGGSVTPWVEGRAAFSLVDRSLAACSDIPGDACPTPWDYCCVTDKLPQASALVKVVDADGTLVATDARELLGLHELQTVAVKGRAQRDEAGNVTILATAIYPYEGDLGQHPPSGKSSHETHDHEHDHDHEHEGESAEESES
jgi:hypothetical protein